MSRAPVLLFTVATLLATGCATSGTLVAESEVLKADVTRARAHGAMECAPVALATAEANLDFTDGELHQANPQRAGEHLAAAKAAVNELNTKVEECASRRLSLTPPPAVPPPAPRAPEPKPTEKSAPAPEDPDRDHDGVINGKDHCPDEAGPIELLGCPLHDRDGDGIPDDKDRCPEVASPGMPDGCPVVDTDQDGIPDGVDRCPNQPEDRDGFQDDDGCPDLDNDKDGVTDDKDKCPSEAGPIETLGCATHDRDGDGVQDSEDKCPDQPGTREDGGCPRKYKDVEIKDNRIEIRKQIRFRNKSARLVGEDSFAVISEIAQALRDNPKIKRLRIEGHTDSVGNDAANLKLSQKRANAVMSQLVKDGVEPGRLQALGFGETKPISSNSSAEGRAENRRTEFNILEQ